MPKNRFNSLVMSKFGDETDPHRAAAFVLGAHVNWIKRLCNGSLVPPPSFMRTLNGLPDVERRRKPGYSIPTKRRTDTKLPEDPFA